MSKAKIALVLQETKANELSVYQFVLELAQNFL